MTIRSNDTTTGRLLKKALATMLAAGEFEKDWRHKKRVRRIRKSLEGIADFFAGGIMDAPLLVLISTIDDAEVWQDVIVYMVMAEDELGDDAPQPEGDDAA